MQIVLVDWRIRPGAEEDFLDYWRTKIPVRDRARMVGEFLSEPARQEHRWVTWRLEEPPAKRYINVGLWADAAAFHDEIGRYFTPEGGKLHFEHELRQRALLTPACWRMGDWSLPTHDSDGVL